MLGIRGAGDQPEFCARQVNTLPTEPRPRARWGTFPIETITEPCMVLHWPEAPAPGRQKQEDYKFKGILGYLVT